MSENNRKLCRSQKEWKREHVSGRIGFDTVDKEFHNFQPNWHDAGGSKRRIPPFQNKTSFGSCLGDIWILQGVYPLGYLNYCCGMRDIWCHEVGGSSPVGLFNVFRERI